MGTADRLRTDDVAGGGTPAPLVGGGTRPVAPFRANMGSGDVRSGGQLARTWILYGFAFSAGTDSFKLGVYDVSTKHNDNGTERVQAGAATRTDTVAFVHSTNLTAAAIQTALRTATGDGGLTVTGTTDFDSSGFIITFTEPFPGEIVAHTLAGGASVQVARGSVAYDDPPSGSGTYPNTALNGIVHDQESSRGIGQDVPLGTSIVTDGTGQTRGTTLAPPTVDGAAGGTAEVAITATEVASGGTGAVVLYAIRELEEDSGDSWAVVDSEAADGDVTISSLAAGDYVLLAHTQTANGQVSRPAAPVYFTVA